MLETKRHFEKAACFGSAILSVQYERRVWLAWCSECDEISLTGKFLFVK